VVDFHQGNSWRYATGKTSSGGRGDRVRLECRRRFSCVNFVKSEKSLVARQQAFGRDGSPHKYAMVSPGRLGDNAGTQPLHYETLNLFAADLGGPFDFALRASGSGRHRHGLAYSRQHR
jgi:hypothetical protein